MGAPQTFEILDALSTGLRQDKRAQVNSPSLVQCKGLKPTEFGLALPETLEQLDVTDTHPFPQVHSGKRASYVFTNQTVRPYDEDTKSTSTSVTVYKASSAKDPQTDIVADGDFSSASTWDVTDTGVSIAGGKLVFTSVAEGDLAQQDEADQANSGLIAGRLYRVTYTIDSISSGGIKVRLGNTGGFTTTRTAAGTYEEDILAAGTTMDLVLVADDPSGSAATTATLDNVSVKEIEEMTTPSGGGMWNVVDFGDVVFANKDNCCVFRVPYFSDNRWMGFNTSDDDVTVKANCNIGNRMLMALSSSDLFDSTSTSAEAQRWQRLWRIWIESSPPSVVTHTDLEMNSSTVFYTTQSGGDFDLPFVQELSMLGFPVRTSAVDDLEDSYQDVIMKRELGFIPLPWQKPISAIKPFGEGAIAYCGDGISYIYPLGEFQGFDQIELKDVGIAQRGAIAGNRRLHRFIDADGVLWEITAGEGGFPQLTKLGRRDDLSSMLAGVIVGSYDEEEGDSYFVTATEGFVVTNTGVGELVNHLPKSLIRVGDDLVAAYTDLSDDTFTIETNGFDMGLDQQKILDQVGIQATDVTGLSSYVKWRNNRTSGDAGYTATTSTLTNRSNMIHPNQPGRDFRVVVTGTVGTDTKVERITVTFRQFEKRSSVETIRANSPGFGL